MTLLALSLKNIKKLIKEQTGLVCLLIFVEMVCLAAILFTYGIYNNYQTVKGDDILNSRRIYIQFGIDQEGEETDAVQMQTIKNAWEQMELLLKDRICSVLICADSDDKSIRLYGVRNYTEVKYEYLDLTGQELLVEGRFFSQEEQESGAPVALSFWENQEKMTFDQTDFTVIGTMMDYFGGYEQYVEGGNSDLYYVPLKAIPEDAYIHYIELYTTQILSAQMEEQIKALFLQAAGSFYYEGCDTVNIADIEARNGIMLLAIFMAVLSSINLLAIYGYLCEKRQNEFAVFRVCGGKRHQLCIIMLLEILIMSCISVLGANLIYAGILERVLEKYFIYFGYFYSNNVYIRFSLLYILVLIIFGGIMVSIRSIYTPVKIIKGV